MSQDISKKATMIVELIIEGIKSKNQLEKKLIIPTKLIEGESVKFIE
jgi:DNA-binding LacI/PurR family transcriptional regulator